MVLPSAPLFPYRPLLRFLARLVTLGKLEKLEPSAVMVLPGPPGTQEQLGQLAILERREKLALLAQLGTPEKLEPPETLVEVV